MVGGDPKSQKPRLRLNTVPSYFAFLGVQLGICIHVLFALPAPSRPRVTYQRCRVASSHLSLSLLVRPFLSLETLLAHVSHCLELIASSSAFSVLLSMLLGKFLYLGAELPLDCPHHATITVASLYSIRIHLDYVLRVFLRDLRAYLPL